MIPATSPAVLFASTPTHSRARVVNYKKKSSLSTPCNIYLSEKVPLKWPRHSDI